MALQAGRRGVLPSELTPDGRIKNSGGGSSVPVMDYANIVDTNSINGYNEHPSPVTYTAPKPGIVYVSTEAPSGDLRVKVNNVFVGHCKFEGDYFKACIPVVVKTGDVVTEGCTLAGTSTTYVSRFIFVPFA